MTNEIKETVTVHNAEGLHARPASVLVQAIKDLECQVYLGNEDGDEIDAKSILGVLMLAAEQGTTLTLRATGPDASRACAEVRRVLHDTTGEARA